MKVVGEEKRGRDGGDRVSQRGLNLGKNRKKLKETEVEARSPRSETELRGKTPITGGKKPKTLKIEEEEESSLESSPFRSFQNL